MELRRALGIGGSVVLMGSVFTPIVSAPFLGSLNYFRNGEGDGTIVLALGAISLAIVWANSLRLLLVTVTLSLATLAFTFVSLQLRLGEMRSRMATELAGNPFAGLATGMVESVQLQWGWALLVAGAGAREAALALNAKGLAEALQAERPRNGSGTRNSLPKPEWPRSIDAHREI